MVAARRRNAEVLAAQADEMRTAHQDNVRMTQEHFAKSTAATEDAARERHARLERETAEALKGAAYLAREEQGQLREIAEREHKRIQAESTAHYQKTLLAYEAELEARFNT